MLSATENQSILTAWAVMSEKEQVQMLTANIKKAAKNEISYSVEARYNEYNERVLWFMRNHGIDGLVNEAYCKLAPRLTVDYLTRLNERRATAGKQDISLVSLVYRAAKDAIRTLYSNDIKHGRASVRTITDNDSYIDTMTVTPKNNTEYTALFNITLDSIINGRDDIDRMIIEGKRDGYTEREIATATGISGPVIHKRIDKIRTALKLEIA